MSVKRDTYTPTRPAPPSTQQGGGLRPGSMFGGAHYNTWMENITTPGAAAAGHNLANSSSEFP
ncbi:hypothetical protein E2C01_079822 [Portunus trituberculatus]|uniref:Uncharacterized protein n=1 Tax=Portunus trituberculatus TaxID=210409 RepID=A0A5B7IRU2_PORTR|nr:hypothetical protein [Portunus trituberculatus]